MKEESFLIFTGTKLLTSDADEFTEEIVIEKGVRQGCVLSPVLFNLHSKMLMCEALSETEGVKINGEKIKTIRYADGTAMTATSKDKLQRMMDKIQAKCEEYGMSLNTKKRS